MTTRDAACARLARIATTSFSDVVEGVRTVEGKLRLLFTDGSFLDIWLSAKKPGVYAYHWERRHIDRTVFRHNNLPDRKARRLSTFPKHFHKKTENNIVESTLSDKPEEALKTIFQFVRKTIRP